MICISYMYESQTINSNLCLYWTGAGLDKLQYINLARKKQIRNCKIGL